MEKNKSLIYEAAFRFISPKNEPLNLSFDEISRLDELFEKSNKRLKEFEESFEEQHLFFNPEFVPFFNIGDEISLDDFEKNENLGLKWNFGGWAKDNVVSQAINHDFEIASINGYVFGGERVVIKIVGKEFVFDQREKPSVYLKCLIVEDFGGQ